MTVEVIKRDANVGDFVVTITPLTYSQFNNIGVPLPSELPVDMRPSDPAECECKLIIIIMNIVRASCSALFTIGQAH